MFSGLRTFRVDADDGLALLGFVAVEYGISRWSTPAAWVVGGIALMAVAIWPYLRKGKR